tara:strand:+ start:10696 stop:10980 length:285 start_codon:yes stop_codon:yes gene_type:complete
MKIENNRPCYAVGDSVVLESVFDPSAPGSTKKLEKSIVVKVIRISNSSLGYNYELKYEGDISLGGVMYWEKDILYKAFSKEEAEEIMWKTWGDH